MSCLNFNYSASVIASGPQVPKGKYSQVLRSALVDMLRFVSIDIFHDFELDTNTYLIGSFRYHDVIDTV